MTRLMNISALNPFKYIAPYFPIRTLAKEEREKNSIVNIAFTFIKEKPKDVLKLVNYSIFWTGKVISDLNPSVKKFSSSLGNANNLLGALEVPEKAYTLWRTLLGVVPYLADGGKVSTAASAVLQNAAFLTNSVCEGIKFSKKYIKYDENTLGRVEAISYAATLGGSSIGAYEQFKKLVKMEEIQEETFYMEKTFNIINLWRDISYATLGALGVRSIITKTPLESWMVIACLTSGLLSGIGSNFYEKIFDPERRGKNLDSKVVFENAVLGRKYKTA